MKRYIVVMLLLVVLPAVAWAQSPSNEELFQMIKKMERKLDAAIGEANRAKEDAARAREEAAKAKEELTRIKEASGAAVPAESLVRVPETEPSTKVSFEAAYVAPSRSNLDFVIVDSDADNNPEGSLLDVEPDYHWGGRIGVSRDFGSGTDFGARFSWLNTNDSKTTGQPAGGALWATWLHPNGPMDDNDPTRAEASYDFEQYVFDLGAGQSLDIGKHFGLRIGAGLRYARMDQEIDILYIDDIGNDRVDISNENEFTGWGVRAGLDLDWRLGRGFSIFSSVAGSVLVGDFDLSLSQIDNGATVRASIKDNVRNRVVPVIELRAGIGYEYQLKNGWAIGARAGYEWQNWFNTVTAQRFMDDVDAQLMYTDTTDIGLDGFFLEGFINF